MITADCESLRSAVGCPPMRCARLATGWTAIESPSTSGGAGSEASRATGWTPCWEIGTCLTPTLFNAGSTLCANSALKSEVHVVHLVHAEGRGPSPMPLLLTHGWPGSFLEYLPVLPLLSDPGAHGADPADAFTVVVPSLPGYGFSGPPPPTGMTGRQVARLWYELMTVGLGYERFVAHGGDLGAGVTAWLARDQPDALAAIHLATPGLTVAPGPRTAHEEDFARAVQDWTAEEGGYMHEHATKPGTLGAALSDSPAGLAAWIGEKIVAWSSTRPDGSPAFDRELLLATLTLYWATDTIATSLLPYWAHRHLPGAALPPEDVSPVPTAISIFGGERVPFPKPPRELAERYYNVTSWAEHL